MDKSNIQNFNPAQANPEPNTLDSNPIYMAPNTPAYEQEQRELNRQAMAAFDKAEAAEPDTMQQAAAAFELNNPISAYVASEAKPFVKPMEGYKVEDHIAGYEDHWEAFAGSQHPDTTDWIKRSLDTHKSRTATLEAGDWRGTFAAIAASMVSPTNLALVFAGPLGVGVGAGAGSIGVSAARSVASGLVATSADEALLHSLQPGRTAEETMYTMGATVALDGILGGVVGKLTKNAPDSLVNQTAAMLKDGPAPELVGDAGAAFHGPMTSGAPLKEAQPMWKYTGVDWLARKMAKVTPNGRLAQSNVEEVRRALYQLSETHMRVKGDALPTAIETEVKTDQRNAAIDIIGVRKQMQESGLDQKEFAGQWASAMRFGVNDSTNEHVAKAAVQARKNIYDYHWQKATDAGLEGTYYEKKVKDLSDEERALTRGDGTPWVDETLTEDMTVRLPVSQKTAPEYLQRHYDIMKVRDDPAGFQKAVRTGLEDSQARANTEIDAQVAEAMGDSSVRGDLGDKVIADHYEGMQDAQDTILKEAKRQYPNAVQEVKDLQKLELSESADTIELPALAAVAKQKYDVRRSLSDLNQLEKDIKYAANKNIERSFRSTKGTQKDRIAERTRIRDIKRKRLAEVKAQKGVHQQRLVDITAETKAIRAEGVEARKFIKARRDQLMQGLDSRLSKLKRASPDISLKQYRQAKTRYTKAEADFEAKISELESNRPPEYDENEWATIVENYYANVTNLKPGDVHAFASSTGNSMFKHRVDIKDEFLTNFLESDPEVMMGSFVNAISPKVHMASINGGRSGDYMLEGMLGDIQNAYRSKLDAALAVGDTKLHKKLELEAQAATKDIRAIRDQMLGMGTPSSIADTNPLLASGIRTLRNWNSATKLGAVNIASIPDLSRLMVYDTMGNFATAAAKAFKNIGLENLPADDLAALASASARVNDVRWADMMAVDDVVPVTRVEMASKWAAHKTLKWSGMQHMDAIDKTLSGYLVSNKLSRNLAQGADMGNLKHLGFDDYSAEVAQEMIRKHGTVEDDWFSPNLDMWRETPTMSQVRVDDAMRTFETAVVKEADRMIMTPGVGDKPVLMSTEVGKSVLQFKSFIIGATNRISIPLMQEQGIRPLLEMGLAIGLGTLAMTAKHVATGQDIDWDPELVAKDSLDRSGLVAYTFEMYNMFNKVSGFDPIASAKSTITGDEYSSKEASKYRSRDVWGSILGPSAGTVSNLLKGAGANAGPDARVHALRRSMFLQNHWAIRRLATTVEGQIAKAIGGTGKYAEKSMVNKPVQTTSSSDLPGF